MKKKLPTIMSLFVLFLFVTCRPIFSAESTLPTLDRSLDSKEKITAYREVLKNRISGKRYFLEEEMELFKKNNYIIHEGWVSQYNEDTNETYEFYSPAIFTWNNKPYLIYTSFLGYTYEKDLDTPFYKNEFIGYAHDPFEKPKDSIPVTSTQSYQVLFSSSTGRLTVYQFGEEKETHEIPKDSVYCGHSFWEGYIFRSGTDVYCISLFANQEVFCIAHDVQYVIDSEYYYSSDRWSQPIFLMTDGTLKVYISSTRIKEELNKAPDDPIFLYEPLTEGSYR